MGVEPVYFPIIALPLYALPGLFIYLRLVHNVTMVIDKEHRFIAPQQQQALKPLLSMAVIWNLLAHGFFWPLFLSADEGAGWGGLLLISFFPVVGVVLALVATMKYRQWRRFAAIRLSLSPCPGRIGGEVGGRVLLPTDFDPHRPVTVSLKCLAVHVSRSRNGPHYSENLLWQDVQRLQVEPDVEGYALCFVFEVPAGQASSSPPAAGYTSWRVHLQSTLRGADLDCSFEIPVSDEGEYTSSEYHSSPLAPVQDFPSRHVHVDGGRYRYPASRAGYLSLMSLLFGVGFSAFAWLFIPGEASAADFFVCGFVVLFAFIGLLLTLKSLWHMGNSLEVEIDAERLKVTRRWFLLSWSRQLPLDQIRSLHFKATGQYRPGYNTGQYYRLYAKNTRYQPITLGDTIRGRPLADQLMEHLGQQLGRNDWQDQTGEMYSKLVR